MWTLVLTLIVAYLAGCYLWGTIMAVRVAAGYTQDHTPEAPPVADETVAQPDAEAAPAAKPKRSLQAA